MEHVTEKQQKVLEFINAFKSKNGFMPTVREIADTFDVHIGAIQKHMKALIKKGHLVHNPKISRGLSLPKIPMVDAALALSKNMVSIPILGSIPAGVPLEALEDTQEHLYVDVNIVKSGHYFCLKVKGDSMTGAGIMDGDTIVVRNQNSANHNDIVVAMVDGEATVKKLYMQGTDTHLEPTNPAYHSIYGEIDIMGKVVLLNRKF